MSLTAGIITLAQRPGALSTAAAASTLTPSLPAAQGPCPVGGPAPRFQIWGGQFSFRAFTESTQTAGVTAGRGRQSQSQAEPEEGKVGRRIQPSLDLSFPGSSTPQIPKEGER